MKRSSVDLLPPEVRTSLDQALIRQGFGGFTELVALLHQHGYQISRSALGRYSQRLQRRVETVKAATEAAKALAIIEDEEDSRSAAVISMIQSDMFESLLFLQEAEEDDDPYSRIDLMGRAARAMADLTRASIVQKRWMAELQQKLNMAKDNAANTAARIAQSGGLSADLVAQIRREVLGIQI